MSLCKKDEKDEKSKEKRMQLAVFNRVQQIQRSDFNLTHEFAEIFKILVIPR